MAVATWAFLVGGSTALFVGAKHGILAIIIGTLIGAVVVSIGICISSGKYGTEQYTLLRSVFGHTGSRLMLFLLLVVFGVGWASVLSIMFGRASTNILNVATGSNFSPNGLVVTAFGLLGIAISWLALWRGPVSINWLNRSVAPGLLGLSAVMLYLILYHQGWDQIVNAEPTSPTGDTRVDFMIAVELSLSATLGWWPITGNVARLTRSPRSALWPNMVGIGLAQIVATCVGLLAALALRDADPTVWMIPLGGLALGIFALVFIALANITSMVVIFYGMAIALRQGGGWWMRQPWGKMTALLFLPAAIAAFYPEVLYDNFSIFLSWTVLVFSPVSGVTLVDFLFLRKRRIDQRALYDISNDGKYAFWSGWNFVAFAAILMGGSVYFLLLNPQHLSPSSLFGVLGASGPACIVAGLSYAILTQIFVKPSGRGGYIENQQLDNDAVPAR
jgi:NCS1 family nucleobase:cation symporter-1